MTTTNTALLYPKVLMLAEVEGAGITLYYINRLTNNDPHRGRTAPLTFQSYILYLYSTNIGNEYFNHGI